MDERFARLRMQRLIWWPILATAAVLLLGLRPPRWPLGAILTALAYAFYGAFLAAALSACRRAGLSPAEIIGNPAPEGRAWLKAAALAPLLLLFAAIAVLMTLSLAQLGAPDWAARQAENENADFLGRVGPGARTLLLLMLIFFAPAIEEFVFRGMLMKRWMATRGLWTGIIGSAALFALLHPPSWIGAFVFGIVAGILYLWSRSLLLPILVHSLNNLMVALAILSADDSRAERATSSPFNEGVVEWTVSLVALLLVGGVIVRIVRPLVRDIRARAIATAGSAREG